MILSADRGLELKIDTPEKKITFIDFKPTVFILLLLGLVIGLNLYLSGLRERDLAKEFSDLTPRKMLLALLGETRYTLAAYLWIKVDHYHHEYENRGEYWKNPPLLQLTRFITYLDPHFVQAYSVGGYDLALSFQQKDTGINFIKEGLTNNPDSYELNFLLGFLRFHYKEYSQAAYSLAKAFHLAKDDMDRTNCARLLAHTYDKLGKKAEMIKYVKFVLQYYPQDYWSNEQLKKTR